MARGGRPELRLDLQQGAQSGYVEETQDQWLACPDRQLTVLCTQLFVSADKDAQCCRVDECDLREIDDNGRRRRVADGIHNRGSEGIDRAEVEFAHCADDDWLSRTPVGIALIGVAGYSEGIRPRAGQDGLGK